MFYYHFEDINDLIYWVTVYNLTEPFSNFYEDKDLRKSYVTTLNLIYENKKFYRNILSIDGYGAFERALYKHMLDAAIKHIGQKRMNEEHDFSLQVYLRGVIYTLGEWIRNDMNTTPRVMADYYVKSLPNNLIRFYDL